MRDSSIGVGNSIGAQLKDNAYIGTYFLEFLYVQPGGLSAARDYLNSLNDDLGVALLGAPTDPALAANAESATTATVYVAGTVTGGIGLVKGAVSLGKTLVRKIPWRWGRRGGVCFPAGTLVGTEDGLQPIEQIEPGQHVWAYDVEAGEWRLAPVTARLVREYRGELVTIEGAGTVIEATADHPFWVVEGEGLSDRPSPAHVAPRETNAAVAGRWVDAQHLRPGDVLLLRSGERAPITAVTSRPAHLTVYNLRIGDPQTYAVGDAGVVVHNRPVRWNGGSPIDEAIEKHHDFPQKYREK